MHASGQISVGQEQPDVRVLLDFGEELLQDEVPVGGVVQHERVVALLEAVGRIACNTETLASRRYNSAEPLHESFEQYARFVMFSDVETWSSCSKLFGEYDAIDEIDGISVTYGAVSAGTLGPGDDESSEDIFSLYLF